MDYSEFKEIIQSQIEGELNVQAAIQIHEIQKNNQVTLDGLTILEDGTNISPTIYLNSYYDDFRSGMEIPEICNKIIAIYQNNRMPDPVDIEFFTDFARAGKTIVYKLVNFEKNKALLKDIPHIPYLDLAIVFYCLIESQGINNATILIRNQHLGLWNISDKELYELAIQNTPLLLPDDFNSMEDVISSFLKTDALTLPPPSDASPKYNMYVLTNGAKLFGAACILYHDLLRGIAERLHSCLYILPSSVHEVIIIPTEDRMDISRLSQMVREVNDSQLEEDEILADHAYFYDRKKQALFAS